MVLKLLLFKIQQLIAFTHTWLPLMIGNGKIMEMIFSTVVHLSQYSTRSKAMMQSWLAVMEQQQKHFTSLVVLTSYQVSFQIIHKIKH